MMYRTVTVTPEIQSGVTITATVTPVLVTVIPSLYDEITVEPILHDGVMDVSPTLSESMIDADAEFYTAVRTYGGQAEWYEGDYTVTPRAHDPTVLDTMGLLMRDDVTVLEIPYYETSNVSNGYTVYIADEV